MIRHLARTIAKNNLQDSKKIIVESKLILLEIYFTLKNLKKKAQDDLLLIKKHKQKPEQHTSH